MKTILLAYGGQSGEHEVSCVSAAYLEETMAQAGFFPVPVYIDREGEWHWQEKVHKVPEENAPNVCNLARFGAHTVLRSKKNSLAIDAAFPMVHGTTGEDGTLQGFFEMLSLPYIGAGVATSALCMDKAHMRAVFAAHALPQVDYFTIENTAVIDTALIDKRIESELGYPVFIKPCNMGSSVGVHLVTEKKGLAAAMADAARFDDHLLCEKGFAVRELEVGIYGNFPDYTLSSVGEIRANHDFYSYDAKYLDPKGAELFLKAKIDSSTEDALRRLALRAFAAVRGDGFARIDFFLEKENGKLFLNEINTLPGFTPISMFPQLFKEAGVSGESLARKLIDLGFERFAKRQTLLKARR